MKKTSIAGLHQYSRSGAGGSTGDHPLAESITIDALADPPNENGGLRGRPSKKRSFEDLQKDDHTGPIENGSLGQPDPKRNHHKRMRSRDISGTDAIRDIAKVDEIGSPVREESDDEGPGGAGVLVDVETKTDTNAQRTLEDTILEEEDRTNEPTVGEGSGPIGLPSTSVQESQQPSTTASTAETGSIKEKSSLTSSSGFSNASATSPFGAVKSPTSTTTEPTKAVDPSTTSTSAFASSGLSAFASSEKSPFGASSTTESSGGFGGTGSGFGASTSGFGGGTSTGFGGSKPSGFGSPSAGFGGASPFAKTSSGFGSLGGFGGSSAPKPFGGAVSSFAGPSGGPGTFGKARPFGQKDDDEEDKSDDGDDEAQQDDDESRPDSRFHQQTGKLYLHPLILDVTLTSGTVETGEEDEETIFNCRAKLFHFEQKQWKERGVGNLKINVRYEISSAPHNDKDKQQTEEEDPDLEGGITVMERRGRVLMRTDGVHRVILNSPIFKEMNVGTKDGEEPSGKTMMLTGMEDGRPKGFQIRVGFVLYLPFYG